MQVFTRNFNYVCNFLMLEIVSCQFVYFFYLHLACKRSYSPRIFSPFNKYTCKRFLPVLNSKTRRANISLYALTIFLQGNPKGRKLIGRGVADSCGTEVLNPNTIYLIYGTCSISTFPSIFLTVKVQLI